MELSVLGLAGGSYMGKTDKIVHYVTACRHEGIDVLPPDINESRRDFTATREGIRFGFAGIRGVGEGVAERIIAERTAGGPFKNLNDFAERVDSNVANRRVVEALIKSGAFDSTGYPRRQLMMMVDKNNPENILDTVAKRQKDRAAGQSSLFDIFGDIAGSGFELDIPAPDGVEWERSIKLHAEHDVLGLYVSDHPLRPFEYALSVARDCTLGELHESEEVADPVSGGMTERYRVPDGKIIRLAGMVHAVQKKATKNGDQMAIVTLEDMEGEIDLVVFPKVYKKCAHLLSGEKDPETGETSDADIFIRVTGKLERGDRGEQVICRTVEPLVLDEQTNRPLILEVCMTPQMLSYNRVLRLQEILASYAGMDRVELLVEEVSGNTMRMELPVKVDARNRVLMAEVSDLVGVDGRVAVA